MWLRKPNKTTSCFCPLCLLVAVCWVFRFPVLSVCRSDYCTRANSFPDERYEPYLLNEEDDTVEIFIITALAWDDFSRKCFIPPDFSRPVYCPYWSTCGLYSSSTSDILETFDIARFFAMPRRISRFNIVGPGSMMEIEICIVPLPPPLGIASK